MKAIIYTGEGCSACQQAITWLKWHGVEVEEQSHTDAKIPIYGLPVIEIAGEIVMGFNKTQLTKIIRSCVK